MNSTEWTVNGQRLAGTVALVTGASSGIGEATALELAGHGATVAMVARRAERLAALVDKITSAGGRALALPADITDPAQATEVVNRTVAELGRLDTLVNNAGVMYLGPVVDADVTEWRRMVDLNLMAVLHCCHAALPHLLRAAAQAPRSVADLVNVSSVAGRVVRNGNGVYNATKFGLGAFTESLRQEVTARHVRVSLIEPGAVSTELVSHNRPEIRAQLQARHGEIETLQPVDIADAIGYVVTRPRRVAVNEMFVRPTESER